MVVFGEVPAFQVGADIANVCNESAIYAARRRTKRGIEQRVCSKLLSLKLKPQTNINSGATQEGLENGRIRCLAFRVWGSICVHRTLRWRSRGSLRDCRPMRRALCPTSNARPLHFMNLAMQSLAGFSSMQVREFLAHERPRARAPFRVTCCLFGIEHVQLQLCLYKFFLLCVPRYIPALRWQSRHKACEVTSTCLAGLLSVSNSQ